MSFTQLLPDEGTNKGLLRVVNESAEPLPVTEAGLRWSGYGEFLDPQDSTLAPGQTLDLHVLLPPAHCDEGDEPIVGVVRTPTAEVAQPLTSSGQEFLHHLWQRGCEADLVQDNVSISYADDWHIGTAHGEPAAFGSLLLERNDGTEPVTVRSFRGSVLYGAELPAPVVARPSAPDHARAARGPPGQPVRRARPRSGDGAVHVPDHGRRRGHLDQGARPAAGPRAGARVRGAGPGLRAARRRGLTLETPDLSLTVRICLTEPCRAAGTVLDC